MHKTLSINNTFYNLYSYILLQIYVADATDSSNSVILSSLVNNTVWEPDPKLIEKIPFDVIGFGSGPKGLILPLDVYARLPLNSMRSM